MLYSKENKKNFIKEDKYIDHMCSIHGYPVFAGVPFKHF